MELSSLYSVLLIIGLSVIVQAGHYERERHHFGPPKHYAEKPFNFHHKFSLKPLPSFHKHGYEGPDYERPSYEDHKYDGPSYEDAKYDGPSYEDHEYETPKYEAPKYEHPKMSYEQKPVKYSSKGECKARGMHLADPSDKCRYRQCVVQSEPWEEYGEIPLDIVSRLCPPGTAVPANYAGGYVSPCSEFDDSCGAAKPHSYATTEPPKTYEHPKPVYEPPKQIYQPPKIKGECSFRGQYLPDAADKCAFRRCVVQSEPWEEYGEIPLDIIKFQCAPGSAVPKNYLGGDSNPCTEFDKSCGVQARSYPSYKPAPTYKPAPSYKPAPTYKPAPSYKPAPTYKPAPSYKPAPIYKPAPSYKPAPIYKPVAYKPAPSYHQPPKYEAPKPQPRYKPHGECKARGMLLADPSDKCMYRQCVVQSEPWEVYGEIPLDIVSRLCPPGTAVPANYVGGYEPPCTEFDDSCGAVKTRTYTAPPPKPVETYEPPKTYKEPEPPKQSYPQTVHAVEPTYAPVTYKPQSECKARGMHLADPSDKCRYRQCVVQSEPWEEYGEIPLDIVSRLCPPGTAVPANYAGGYESPCSEFDDSCGAPSPPEMMVPEPTYPPIEEEEMPSYQPMEEEEVPAYPPAEEEEVPAYPPAEEEEVPAYPPIEEEEEEEEEEVPSYEPEAAEEGVCQHRGQLMRDPADKCSYIRCIVSAEPWLVAGDVALTPISQSCGVGSAVPDSYESGMYNPCTLADRECIKLPAKEEATSENELPMSYE